MPPVLRIYATLIRRSVFRCVRHRSKLRRRLSDRGAGGGLRATESLRRRRASADRCAFASVGNRRRSTRNSMPAISYPGNLPRALEQEKLSLLTDKINCCVLEPRPGRILRAATDSALIPARFWKNWAMRSTSAPQHRLITAPMAAQITPAYTTNRTGSEMCAVVRGTGQLVR